MFKKLLEYLYLQMYKNLDLEEFEEVFSAYQGSESGDGDLLGKNAKSKVLSVIVERRAQNCIILLKKLKMTNEEIADVIISMDKSEELPKDMCEQVNDLWYCVYAKYDSWIDYLCLLMHMWINRVLYLLEQTK